MSVEEGRGLQKRNGHGDGSRDIRMLHYGGDRGEEGARSSRSCRSCACPEIDSPLKASEGSTSLSSFQPTQTHSTHLASKTIENKSVSIV